MTKISPEAQALINRLARMDSASPRQDKAEIERAITAHLEALGLPMRPITWVEHASAGYRLIGDRAKDSASGAALDAAIAGAKQHLIWDAAYHSARDASWDAAWVAAKRAIWDDAWAHGRNDALLAARETAVAWSAAQTLARIAANCDIRENAWETVRRDVGQGTGFAISAARRLQGLEMAAAAAQAAVWAAALDAVQDAPQDAAVEACSAIGYVNGLAALDSSEGARLVAISRPMVDAFEAGLFLYWVTPHDVVCVPHPSLSFESGRLHRANGPAICWPSGRGYYFWRGVRVPAWVIEYPEKITVEAIQTERNQELRRCMIEIFGSDGYRWEANLWLVHQDDFGKLWAVQGPDEADDPGSDAVHRLFVEVEDGTPGPDGVRRIYTLDVSDAAEVLGWPIETARAAVAATYQLREEEYCPEVRT